MSSSLYLLLFLILVVIALVVIVFILHKKNSHTELYSEGVRNENNGRYDLALHNYTEALEEIRKLNIDDSFRVKIAQRIKILRTTMDYEGNFHESHEKMTSQERSGAPKKAGG